MSTDPTSTTRPPLSRRLRAFGGFQLAQESQLDPSTVHGRSHVRRIPHCAGVNTELAKPEFG